jgi:hypothetical protein
MAYCPLRLSKLQATVCAVIAFVLKKTSSIDFQKLSRVISLSCILLFCISLAGSFHNAASLSNTSIFLPFFPPSASLSHSLYDQIRPVTLCWLDPRRVPPFSPAWLKQTVIPLGLWYRTACCTVQTVRHWAADRVKYCTNPVSCKTESHLWGVSCFPGG